MKKQYLRIIILSLIIIVQDAISSNPFSEWSRHRPKHYNIKVYGKYIFEIRISDRVKCIIETKIFYVDYNNH